MAPMVVEVLSRIGYELSRSLDSLSLGRGSMLLRLRRASLGMLCLVGAVGFGLIAFIAQLDWPEVLSGPLPDAPAKVGRVDDAVGLFATPGRAGAAVSSGRAARPVRIVNHRGGRTGHGPGRSGLERSHDLASAPSQPSPGTAQPAPPAPAAAEPGGGAQPAAPPPAGSSGPVDAATGGGGSSKGSARATADGGRAAAPAASKSQGQGSSAKSSKPVSSGPGNSAAAKARGDESAATKAPAPPPPAEAASPPAASPAAAKEAADAANSR